MLQEMTLSISIRANPSLERSIQLASKILEDVVAKSRAPIQAQWDTTADDKNREFIELKMKDWSGEVEGFFAPQDLKLIDELYWRFSKLYGDLLRIRSRKSRDELLASLEKVTPS